LFGPALRQAGRSHAIVSVGQGTASLGCLAPHDQPRILVEDSPRGGHSLRLRFSDGQISLNLGITDLRLWEEDHVTPKWDLIEDVKRRMNGGMPCLLTVGLTRPYASSQEDEPVHWLQVNNIHLEDDPAWRLTSKLVPSTSHFVDRRLVASRPFVDEANLEDLPF
jgi:hypothetical protein